MELNPILEPGEAPKDNIWSVISHSNSSVIPSSRSGHSLTQSGRLIGGALPTGFVKDSYLKLNLETQKWTNCQNNINEGYSSHFEIYEQGSIENNNGTLINVGGVKSDIVKEHFISLDYTNLLNFKTIPYPNRTLHNAISLLNNRFLIFYGGGNQGPNPVNDQNIYIIDFENFQNISNNLKIAKVPQTKIPNLQGHVQLPISNDTILIHGGMNGPEIFDNFFKFSILNKKVEEIESDYKPVARAAHCGASLGNKIFIHGGLGKNGQVLEDFWEYEKVWVNLTKNSVVALPTPRLSHSMTVFKIPVFANNFENLQATNSENKNIIELDNWRLVDGDNTQNENLTENLANGDKIDVKIERTINAIAIFGGMDTVGNFFNDLMIFKI